MSMEETQLQIENLEREISDNKTLIKRAEALARLEKNADFKELIGEGFLEKHAIRQVMLKAHPGLQDEKTQKMIDLQMAAIGGLKQFFVSIFAEGHKAKEELYQAEMTLAEIHDELSEGAANVN